MERVLQKISGLLLDLIFPCFCFGCSKEGRFLCADCGQRLEREFLPNSGQPHCAFDYHHPLLRELIFAFKYDQLKQLDQTLAKLLLDFFAQKQIKFDRSWTVSFVPMHPGKQNTRGFNQAELLAAKLAKLLGLPCFATLEKIRPTRPQMQLDKAGRLVNLDRAFRPARDPAGLKILLIDDVCTTGATFLECKKTLLAHGARRVCCLALAKDL